MLLHPNLGLTDQKIISTFRTLRLDPLEASRCT